MVMTSTPLRISFFGCGTDYPAWYREYGGSVLSTTINKSCYITCRRLPPFFEYHSRISYSKIENVRRNDEIEHPSVHGCLQFLGVEEGVEIHHVADLPARTGLGTSSAFTVGLLFGPEQSVAGIVAVIRDDTKRFSEDRERRRLFAEEEELRKALAQSLSEAQH